MSKTPRQTLKTWEQLVATGEQPPNKGNPPEDPHSVHLLINRVMQQGKQAGKEGKPHLDWQRNWLQLSEIGRQCADAYHRGVRSILKNFPAFKTPGKAGETAQCPTPTVSQDKPKSQDAI